MLVPTLNSSVSRLRPGWARPVTDCRPSRPAISSSWRLRISRSISAGAAPGHSVVTVMTGRLTSGASWIGMFCSATRPNITTMSTAATTAIGRSMAVRIRFIRTLR